MGKHYNRRSNKTRRSKGSAQPETMYVPKGCPFFRGQRLFDTDTGCFTGIVVKIEWDTFAKLFCATTDIEMVCWADNLRETGNDPAITTVGQRDGVRGDSVYGPDEARELYEFYDSGGASSDDIAQTTATTTPGIVAVSEAFPDYAGSTSNMTRMDTDEEAFKAHQDYLAHTGGGYYGGC